MNCTSCGKQIADDAARCPYCGAPVSQDDGLAELVAAARTGDQEAVGALYEKTYSKVYYTVKSMIREEDTVLDIVQDAYIKAFAHLDSFQGDTKFLPWVRQIAANTARDWLKKKRPMLFTELSAGDGQETPVEELFPDERSENLPDQVIDQEETKRLIREIVDELPEDQRAAIGMFYYDEMSVKEIAAAMGASESAVKSRLMYGRDKIERKVRELEKRGTKLYGLAPIPFLLLLFRSQTVHAAEAPSSRILQAILASLPADTAAAAGAGAADAGMAAGAGAADTAGTAGTEAQGTAGAGNAGTGAAGGSGGLKIGLIALATVAVVGLGIFVGVNIAALSGGSEEPSGVEEVVNRVELETPEVSDMTGGSETSEEPGSETLEEPGTSEESVSIQEESEEEEVCSYIFTDVPIAALEITGLGIGPDIPVNEELHHIVDDYDNGIQPFVQLTPGENTFILYCFSRGEANGGDAIAGTWASLAAIQSPAGSGPWEANHYIADGYMFENPPEGLAWIAKQYGGFSEEDGGRFPTVVDAMNKYIEFSEIFHSGAPQPDAIYAAEIQVYPDFVGYDSVDYGVEENIVSGIVKIFEECGATVQEIPVEEALARDHITVSEKEEVHTSAEGD